MGVSGIGWWGCGSCGRKVSNDHVGPCLDCGGRIRRIVPPEINAVLDLGIVPYHSAGEDRPSVKPNSR